MSFRDILPLVSAETNSNHGLVYIEINIKCNKLSSVWLLVGKSSEKGTIPGKAY